MFNIGETRLPFYSYLPTMANQKARSFNQAWESFNRFLFEEYEDGRLNSGDVLLFAMMEQLKVHALELEELEVGCRLSLLSKGRTFDCSRITALVPSR